MKMKNRVLMNRSNSRASRFIRVRLGKENKSSWENNKKALEKWLTKADQNFQSAISQTSQLSRS